MYKVKKLRIKAFLFYKRERSDNMAIAQLERNPSIIISEKQANNFFELLNKNKPTKQFWDDCKAIRESITSEDIDAMDILIAKRLKRNE